MWNSVCISLCKKTVDVGRQKLQITAKALTVSKCFYYRDFFYKKRSQKSKVKVLIEFNFDAS